MILPWLAWMIVFQIWSIYVVPRLADEKDGAKYVTANTWCEALLVIFAIARIGAHIYNFGKLYSFYRHGHMIYFKNYWNFFDLLPAILIIMFVGFRTTEKRQREVLSAFDSQILSIICVCIWVQAFNLLRLFEWSGYLVRMIILCFYDVRVFGAIFFSAVLAFANSFYLLGRQLNPVKTPAVGRVLEDAAAEPMFSNFISALIYTYKTSMGDWDTDSYNANNNSTVLLWLNWLTMSVVALIVMLNLLIAIVSVTFENVMSTAA